MDARIAKIDECPKGLLATLASVKLTLVALVLFAIGSWGVSGPGLDATWAAGLPLGLLAVNLCAALLTNARLRVDLPLVVLHVALLILIVLLAVSRLTYFDGIATLTVGEEFKGALEDVKAGPLHRLDLDGLGFRNEGFSEAFDGGRYVATEQRLSWRGGSGTRNQAVIGDDRPLALAGYRIYTTPSRGYVPNFFWSGHDGHLVWGSVQLKVPDFVLAGLQPLTVARTRFKPISAAQAWQLPDGTEAWVMLETEEDVSGLAKGRRSNLDASALPHHLVLRVGEQRWTIRPGETIELPNGALTYQRLDSWMGYRIVRDDIDEWIFAVCIVALLSLGWFYIRNFRSSQWCRDEVEA